MSADSVFKWMFLTSATCYAPVSHPYLLVALLIKTLTV